MSFLHVPALIRFFICRQVLVTHHVELVLPGAYYLIRMLDGRIDTQGTVKDLRERGVLEGIKHDTALDVHKEQIAAAEATTVEQEMDINTTKVAADDDMAAAKKPRKLVKDEHRETGGVKWSIYKSYLEASYGIFSQCQSHLLLTFFDSCSSYWTWVFLAFLVVLIQILGVSEKLWIKVKQRGTSRHIGVDFLFSDMGRSL